MTDDKVSKFNRSEAFDCAEYDEGFVDGYREAANDMLRSIQVRKELRGPDALIDAERDVHWMIYSMLQQHRAHALVLRQKARDAFIADGG